MRQHELTRRMLQLRGVPTLRQVPASDLARIAAQMRARTFERGDELLAEGDEPRSFFLLTQGTVSMARAGRSIGNVRAPGAVGFMSFLAATGAGMRAVAETYVEALEVRAESMEELFEDHFDVVLGTMRLVADLVLSELKGQEPMPFVPPVRSLGRPIGPGELDIVERMFLLRWMVPFRDANLNSLASLARKMVEVRVPAGETLWSTGDRADVMLFVFEGMLSQRTGRGVQKVGPGYVLGGAETLAGRRRWNDLVADEPAFMLRASREALVDLFEDDLDQAFRFLSTTATLLLQLWDRRAARGDLVLGRNDGLSASFPDPPPVGPPSSPRT